MKIIKTPEGEPTRESIDKIIIQDFIQEVSRLSSKAEEFENICSPLIDEISYSTFFDLWLFLQDVKRTLHLQESHANILLSHLFPEDKSDDKN